MEPVQDPSGSGSHEVRLKIRDRQTTPQFGSNQRGFRYPWAPLSPNKERDEFGQQNEEGAGKTDRDRLKQIQQSG